jgi:hypothetical protein
MRFCASNSSFKASASLASPPVRRSESVLWGGSDGLVPWRACGQEEKQEEYSIVAIPHTRQNFRRKQQKPQIKLDSLMDFYYELAR